jgi:hypothetical protein
MPASRHINEGLSNIAETFYFKPRVIMLKGIAVEK